MKYCSEHGEDRWLNEFDGALPDFGFYVDVGAAHPWVNSNTSLLRTHLAWTGLAIDGDPRWATYWETPFVHRVLGANRDPVRWFQNEANPFRSGVLTGPLSAELLPAVDVTPSTLEDVLLEHRVERIDLLSLDVNGYESEVWAGLDWERHQPGVLIVQRAPQGQPDPVLETVAALDCYQLGASTVSNFVYIKRK